MVCILDEKKQDVYKFNHSHLGTRQQISSRDILASNQDKDTVLGTTCLEHSRGVARRNGAGRRLQNCVAGEGLQRSKEAGTENKTQRCAWLPGAQEPSHCLPAIAIQP